MVRDHVGTRDSDPQQNNSGNHTDDRHECTGDSLAHVLASPHVDLTSHMTGEESPGLLSCHPNPNRPGDSPSYIRDPV